MNPVNIRTPMKSKLILLAGVLVLSTAILSAQSTAFTYQGRLHNAGTPADGLYEMQFTLYDALVDGHVVGTPQTAAPVAVNNGLFAVSLNFGPGAFMGADRWLEITVTVFGSDMVPTKLEPRQPLTAAPYALHALNAASLMSSDSAPLDIKIDGQRTLRLEAGAGGAPNVIGGSSVNSAAPGVQGAAIGGGGSSMPGSEAPNRVQGNFGTIGGGGNNTIGLAANHSTIGGGFLNTIHEDAAWSAIGGGQLNAIQVDALHSTIGGGYGNHTAGDYSAVGGGQGNAAENISATVAGGDSNYAGGAAATVAGGYRNSAQGFYSLIGGGQDNLIAEGALHSVIGGGWGNTNLSYESVIAGGFWNQVTSLRSAIGGGAFNRTEGDVSTVAGGFINRADGYVSTVAGGYGNRSAGAYAFVGGGQANVAESTGSTVAGGDANHAQASYAAVGGGQGNEATGYAAVIAGGGGAIDGGETQVGNAAMGSWSTIGGGLSNTASGSTATVGGGGSNRAIGFASVIAGGGGLQADDGNEDRGNTARGDWSAIGGGADNVAEGLFSVVAGGEFNRALGNYGMILGGLDCEASGLLSFAAGWGAKAVHNGAFVWADNSPIFGGPPFESTANNQFMARAAGGVRFFTDMNASTGAELAPGSGTWSSLSDRNKKENFAQANTQEVLEKVVALPLASWNYKTQDASIRHLGPTAQDFRAAFGLGENDRTITTVDADGVALAAIQGLNRKLEEQLKAQDAQLRDLQATVDELKDVIRALAERGGGVIGNR